MSTKTVHLYGIKNCDTMKKALNWMAGHGVEHEFHDYKKEGVDRDKLVEWCKIVGWKTLINTKGTTWKKLTPEQQAVTAQGQAVALMLENPSLIRRPVVELNGQLLVGFDPTLFESLVQ
ncbi:MAG: arsenate reductase [Rhodocyclaceae bacterium]|nr:arsenate reductase [Rhodocyclaceae bacterium]